MTLARTAALVPACMMLFAGTAAAQVSIQDGNSAANFDAASGQVDWTIDGVDQLFAQQFYFRRNGIDTQEYRVDSSNLNLAGSFTTDTNPFSDNRDDAYGILFNDGSGLEIEILYTLRGGTNGSGRSDLAEQIVFRNNSGSALDLSFFQFVDFDLGGDAGDDFAQILNPNTVAQSDNNFFVSETVVTPAASLFDVDFQGTIASLLNNSSIDDLSGNSSFAGDAAWAFQWNFQLAAGQSFLISKDKGIVPAPGAAALLGIAGLAATRRRRS